MKKQIVGFMTAILLLTCHFVGFAVESNFYPVKAMFPKGVENVNSSLFLNSKIKRPIEMDFEGREELVSIAIHNQSGQLAISEDVYSGKFALKIKQLHDEILSIKETEYFQITDILPDTTTDNKSDELSDKTDFTIQVNGKTVIVSGIKAPKEMVSLLVEEGNQIAYIDQTDADVNGFYKFTFTLNHYGTYQLSVGGSKSTVIRTSLVLDETSVSEPVPTPIEPTVGIDMKCNCYTFMLKPMYKSEKISFYVKVQSNNGLDSTTEQYALVKSDKDGDGIYEIGEDLSRGKWQAVQLNLMDIEEGIGIVSGLYMKANQGSEWLIDEITSNYKKINETKYDLSTFEKDNVVYVDGDLRFANYTGDENYSTNTQIVSGGLNISEPISEIHIDSKMRSISSEPIHTEATEKILYDIPFDSEEWIVNDANYEALESGVSKKVAKRYYRDTLPSIPESSSVMTIPIRSGIEKRFRIVVSRLSSVSNTITFTVTDKSGNSQSYHLYSGNNNGLYTDWYDDDITISIKNYSGKHIKIWGVEYEPEENTRSDIVMRSQGNVFADLKEFTTDDRVHISYDLVCEKASFLSAGTQLELFEGDAEYPYYTTRSMFKGYLVKQTVSHIVPKIKPNTKVKITNLEPRTNGSTYDEIRLSNFKIKNLQNKDWDLKESYAYYDLVHHYDFNSAVQTSDFAKESVKDFASAEEQYAAVYQDTVGYVNKNTSNKTWNGNTEIEHNLTIYRILNLSTDLAYVTYGNQNIYLHYGLADYCIKGTGYGLTLPANQRVMLVAQDYYTTYMNPNNLTYTNVDGMFNAFFADNGKTIYYSNGYDNNSAYVYNSVEKTSQKLSSDTLICSSPDGTHFLMKNQSKEYYILNRTNGEKTKIGDDLNYTKYMFNQKNELFMFNNYLHHYTVNGIQEIATLSSEGNATGFCTFDSTGEYLLWSYYTHASLYKNTNGVWNLVTSFSIDYSIERCALSNDLSTVYLQYSKSGIYSIDVNTKASTEIRAHIMRMTDENLLLLQQNDNYYLYNPVTGEKLKIFDYGFNCNLMYYDSASGMLTGVTPNGSVFRHHFSTVQPEAKFALSFDGRNNWYAYSGGRWITVSQENTPKIEEMSLSGMTAEMVNSIPLSAYEKLYSDGSDILTVDIAIYMYSNSNNQTPVIEDITIKTIEKDDVSGLFGVHLEKYEKDEYRSVDSLFPIENFGSRAECYYLLYIGNDWLYTYKNNELIKVAESADVLLADMNKSWITFKQYGMNAQELRSVPGEVLSNLFVNEDYANTEFGVIYVVKTVDEDTTDYTVTFRLSSSANFIKEEDIVVEIMMNGGDVKAIDSKDFSVEEIKNLLSWIEARQMGSGEIFYRLKNEKNQHFINYYMINSISVYNGKEYRSAITD